MKPIEITPELLALVAEIERLRDQSDEMQSALEKAVAIYGKPGGPWNVSYEPGAWITMATDAIAKAKGGGK